MKLVQQYGILGFIGVLIVGYVIWAGCSGGNSAVSPDLKPGSDESLVAPGDPSDQISPDQPKMILGAYRISIDEPGVCTVVPLRQVDAHFDVTNMVFPPNCNDCFQGTLVSQEGEDWTFNFTLKNPSAITGYDVRAVLLDMAGITLISAPDSYTEMYASPEDPTPVNPFFIFDSGKGLNVWGPMAVGSREVGFTRPEGAKFSEIDVVIDASWPGNQEEPTRICNMQFSNDSIPNNSSTTINLTCHIVDRQEDVDSVTVDLLPLGGGSAVALTDNGFGNWFVGEIKCSPLIEAGVKTLWITATSGGDSIQNKVNLTVEDWVPGPDDPADWTVLVYLHAADLPDEEDINEMEMSGSLEGEFNFIVLWDKTGGEDCILEVDTDPEGHNATIISEAVDDGGAVIPPGGLDMSDGLTLETFLLWAMDEYPANHYLLDLWDHGAGIFVGEDQPLIYRNVCGGLTLWEIRDACETALEAQTLVDKFDIIGFDVCILGWIETAYCLRDVADIVIASENNEPGGGWDYGPPFINLRDNINTCTAQELAYDIVESYMDSYTDPGHPYHYLASDCTQAASSTSALVSSVIPALNAFAQACMDNLPAYQTELGQCRALTSYWGTGVSDIGHFAYQCTEHADLPANIKIPAQTLVDAVESAMIHHGHNSGVPAAESGWKIWFPADISTESTSFCNQYQSPGFLEFGDTVWNDFLWAFCGEDPVISGWLQIEQVEFDDSAGGNGNGVAEPDELIDVTLTVRNNGDATATNVGCTLAVASGSESEFEINFPTQTFPDTNPGQIGTNVLPFQFHILGTATSGTMASALADLTCDQSESTNIPVTFPIDPSDYLLIDLDVDWTTGVEIIGAVEALGYTVDQMINGRIAEAPMESYPIVFITLGMFALDDYAPDQDDYDAVEAYLNSGGMIYMEGGDVWYWMPYLGCPDFCPLFGIFSDDDGSTDDLDILSGEPGTFLAGLTLTYTGDADWPDNLYGTGGGEVVLTNNSPEFGAMVAYDSGTYRTIGTSFEFGGIEDGLDPNTKLELMTRILSFLVGP